MLLQAATSPQISWQAPAHKLVHILDEKPSLIHPGIHFAISEANIGMIEGLDLIVYLK